MLDFYDLQIEEIEKHLNINQFNYQKHKDDKQIKSIILDDWEEVSSFLKEQREQQKANFNIIFSLYGYEFRDQHYIEVFYKTSYSLS